MSDETQEYYCMAASRVDILRSLDAARKVKGDAPWFAGDVLEVLDTFQVDTEVVDRRNGGALDRVWNEDKKLQAKVEKLETELRHLRVALMDALARLHRGWSDDD